MENIRYEINKADRINIEKHLRKCSELYKPPLDTYVDIPKYAEKIANFADTFEAWHNDEIVALIACYLNDEGRKEGYITSVSTNESFQGQGISQNLFSRLFDNVTEKGFIQLALEVNKKNIKAINFYEKIGFAIDQSRISEESYWMIRINKP